MIKNQCWVIKVQNEQLVWYQHTLNTIRVSYQWSNNLNILSSSNLQAITSKKDFPSGIAMFIKNLQRLNDQENMEVNTSNLPYTEAEEEGAGDLGDQQSSAFLEKLLTPSIFSFPWGVGHHGGQYLLWQKSWFLFT